MYRSNFMTMIVMAMVQHVPPHWFFGYRLDEWLAIVGVASAFAAVVVWLVKTAIINPQNAENRRQNEKANEMNQAWRRSIDGLADGVKELRASSDQIHRDLDRRIDDHEARISVNENEIHDIKEQIK